MSGRKLASIDGGKKQDDCPACGGRHMLMRCPWVSRVALFEDGSLMEVEFFDSATSRGTAAPETPSE